MSSSALPKDLQATLPLGGGSVLVLSVGPELVGTTLSPPFHISSQYLVDLVVLKGGSDPWRGTLRSQ